MQACHLQAACNLYAIASADYQCRSKRILGFQRQGQSNQARLHWHGRAPEIHEPDAMPMNENAISEQNNDDAAMAAADNIELDFW